VGVQYLFNKFFVMAVVTRSRNAASQVQSGSLHSNSAATDVVPVRRLTKETNYGIDPHKHQSLFWQALKLLICVSGIYGAYITQGLFQEVLSTKEFSTPGSGFSLNANKTERFPHLATLNSFQSWACFLWAFALIGVTEWLIPVVLGGKSHPSEEHPPMLAYWKAGFTNCFGPACGFQALYYIPYPAQVLAKSSKMIPVMVLGTLLHHQRYPLIEYIFCLLVTSGVSIFAGFSGKSSRKVAFPNAPLGYFLCFSNLMLDGYTNVTQDAINKKYKGSTALHMMCWMNFWTGVFYVPMMFVFSNAGREVLHFCWVHPEAGYDILSFCVCGAVGQLFIFYTIKSFGSLTNTLVTTTRKFFSILASVLWSGNALIWQQWVAVCLVFSGLLSSSLYKHTKKRHQKLH